MAYINNNYRNRDSVKIIFGRFIRDAKVICIDQDNNNLGVVDTIYALDLAKQANLELVLVSVGKAGAPSTCRILDLNKYRYELIKKDKNLKKKQRQNIIKIKEVKFRPSTHDNDLLTKARQLKDFLDEGNKIKISVMFRGRELAHKDIGLEIIHKFANMISATFDGEPSLNGKNLIAVLVKQQVKPEDHS